MVILGIIALIQTSFAGEYLLKNIDIQNLYIETHKHVLSNRTPLLKDNQGKEYSLLMGLNTDIGKYFFSAVEVGGFTDQYQFRHVYLDIEKGWRPYRDVEIFIKHRSGHSLDYKFEDRFPEDNSIGIRLNLIKKEKK